MAAILECSGMSRHTISIKKARYHRYRSRFSILLKRSKRCLSSFSTELCSFCSATAFSQKAMGLHSQTYSPWIFVYIFTNWKGCLLNWTFCKSKRADSVSLAFFEAHGLNSKSLQARSMILRKFYNSSTRFTTVAWGGKKHPSRGNKIRDVGSQRVKGWCVKCIFGQVCQQN